MKSILSQKLCFSDETASSQKAFLATIQLSSLKDFLATKLFGHYICFGARY